MEEAKNEHQSHLMNIKVTYTSTMNMHLDEIEIKAMELSVFLSLIVIWFLLFALLVVICEVFIAPKYQPKYQVLFL